MLRFLLFLLSLIAATSAQFNWGPYTPYTAVTQLPQGSLDGWVYNGKGGLGRFVRHSEHRDNRGYYPNGKFNFVPPAYYQQLFYGK
ncbi:hypothetical protein PRIPAC_70653 [Pristionchus pacificus]|uniref:Uncharacterized protein n=1 Tax=Pristionchus pacificus TaxID=54126 RepID=A0A454Y4R3_PRIPA|nr:hypothetical protein PRIPAC_70653 [Pristionchus pacificus]|eukprot:PDM72075.1 hypothetical protein PRIPAC_38482 [Pristionchus pacificus]